MTRLRETEEARDLRRAVAFERGWVDSLMAYQAIGSQPTDDIYDYSRGWHACAAYRWADPKNRGVALDPSYRPNLECSSK